MLGRGFLSLPLHIYARVHACSLRTSLWRVSARVFRVLDVTRLVDRSKASRLLSFSFLCGVVCLSAACCATSNEQAHPCARLELRCNPNRQTSNGAREEKSSNHRSILALPFLRVMRICACMRVCVCSCSSLAPLTLSRSRMPLLQPPGLHQVTYGRVWSERRWRSEKAESGTSGGRRRGGSGRGPLHPHLFKATGRKMYTAA